MTSKTLCQSACILPKFDSVHFSYPCEHVARKPLNNELVFILGICIELNWFI